jgi:hypothetical protein
MKRLTFALILLLLASPAWAMSTVYRHLEPETVVYQTLPSATQTQFTTNENIKLIKYGSGITLSSITANLSQINGTAFVSNPSVDLRPYVGFKGTWSDVGTAGVGFFGAAGTGETLGSDVSLNNSAISDGRTEANSVGSYFSSTSPTTFESTNAGNPAVGSYHIHVVAQAGGHRGFYGRHFDENGKLYQTTYDFKRVSGNINFTLSNAAVSSVYFSKNYTSGTVYLIGESCYGTAISGQNYSTGFGTMDTSGGEWYVDNLQIHQVLTPSGTGTKITSSVGGPQNWLTVGTTPNAATFNVQVSRQ